MSNRTADLDPDALAAFKQRVAAVRAEKAAPAPRAKRTKGASKLAQRIRREADAHNYGDGRRRAKDPEIQLVQLNNEVPSEVKELVRTMAAADRENMGDVVIKAVYAYHEIWQAKRGKVIS